MKNLTNGSYTINAALSGGSGRAHIKSPADLEIKDGAAVARIEWSSPDYDYMKIGENEYRPVNSGGNSVFAVTVPEFDADIPILAETTAMSEPHMIEYSLRFDSSSIKPAAHTGIITALIPAAVLAAAIASALAIRAKRRKSR